MDDADPIPLWTRLLAPDWQEPLAELQQIRQPSPAEIAALRQRFDPAEVSLALQLADARRRAAGKLSDPEHWLLDRAGVEQASGSLVAAHKARRFAAAPVAPIFDLCCGVGGDARELAAACAGPVVGVDRDALRCFMTRYNAGIECRQADVGEVELAGAWLHLDPARRDEAQGRRLWDLDELVPDIDTCLGLAHEARGGAIKLGPGLDPAELPGIEGFELEFCGDRRSLYQAVCWTGELALSPGQHRATRLQDGASVVGEAEAFLPMAAQLGEVLLVPEPVLERAQLVAGRLPQGYGELAPGLGICTGPTALGDSWFSEYQVLAQLPWRRKKVQAWLRAHDAGEVVVRSRGGAVDNDREQRQLRGSGVTGYTVFGLRLGKRHVALITQPLPAIPRS